MGWRRPDGADPPPETYSVCTEPERFAAVVAEAERLVAALAETYDVEVQRSGATVRLVPREGAPVEVTTTPFPGVELRVGHSRYERLLPDCGCDACDDHPDALVEQLHELVGAVVTGRLTERHTRTWLEVSWPGGGSGTSIDRAARAALGPPGERTGPAWPRRASSSAGT